MAQYTITVINGSGGAKKSSPAKSKKASPPASSNSSSASEGFDKGFKELRGLAAFDIAKNAAFTAADFAVNTVELRTGSQALGERYKFYSNVTKRGVNMFESIMVGAAVGNVPGALLGALSSLTSSAVSFLQNTQTIQMERAVESVGIQLANIRAGGAPRGGGN